MEELGPGEAAALLSEVARMGVEELLITGGEPLEREDFPDLVRAMGQRRIRWSLNTARAPRGDVLRAMAEWPPCFAAVSLDGPVDVHDSIRGWKGAYTESLEAIHALSELTGGHVAAGTTVSRLNYPFLGETFAIVIESGATSWGLHLVVPEGRARRRADMTLSPREVRGLIRFTSEKRKYFPVTLADELGFCGAWEPLVRSAPFFCGAGRTQCVVLPNGDVVPCTTFDPRERVGNVRLRPLSEIWAGSFEHLRQGNLLESCAACGHAAACGGGCWLQRRHGDHCHRDVWDRPSSLTTAASLAVCLGLSGCSRPAVAPDTQHPGPDPTASQASETIRTPGEDAQVSDAPAAADTAAPRGTSSNHRPLPAGMSDMDAIILEWYAAELRNVDPQRASIASRLGDDPARPFLESVFAGEPRPPWPARAAQLSAAMKTQRPSLHLVSMLWRDVATWCFDGPSPDRRSQQDAELLIETLIVLGKVTKSWRQTIFEGKLHPFLHRDDPGNRRSFLSKAGPPPMLIHSMRSARKHWAVDRTDQEITRAYLDAHPFAESMSLQVGIPAKRQLRIVTQDRSVESLATIRILDLVQVVGEQPLVLQVAHGQSTVGVRLPPRVTISYPDLLRLAYEQNVSAIDSAVDGEATTESNPLLLPALRSKLTRLEASGGSDRDIARTRGRLVDAWLF
jgi:radical SAM protein with 4Fe4S-binding SPASM domain